MRAGGQAGPAATASRRMPSGPVGRSRWSRLALAAGLTILACSGGRPQPLELTPWSPPRGQSCNTSPPSLALDAVLDTLALAERLAGMALPEGGILLTVSGGARLGFTRPHDRSPMRPSKRYGCVSAPGRPVLRGFRTVDTTTPIANGAPRRRSSAYEGTQALRPSRLSRPRRDPSKRPIRPGIAA